MMLIVVMLFIGNVENLLYCNFSGINKVEMSYLRSFAILTHNHLLPAVICHFKRTLIQEAFEGKY